MGYDNTTLRIPLRLDNHGGDQQRWDQITALQLKQEIQKLIDSDPGFRRIAILGVEGGE